ncbi:MAG TPA: hypothetical protein VK752_05090 [Bryobacteraceae bacterium]|jgi:hypothetical protein|nr:hypothetical protein [Bryobacteraceae bacterium]
MLADREGPSDELILSVRDNLAAAIAREQKESVVRATLLNRAFNELGKPVV